MSELLNALGVARSRYADRELQGCKADTEWMPYYGYATFEEAQRDMTAFVHYYNFERGHSYNRYVPPAIAEAA